MTFRVSSPLAFLKLLIIPTKGYDPNTILGAVAAAAQLADMTTMYCFRAYSYYRDIKEVPSKSKDLREEFSQLSSIIRDLAEVLTTVKTNNSEVGNVISPSSLEQYPDFLKDFVSRLKLNENDFKKRLKWPFSVKENEDYIAKIERHKMTFSLALNMFSWNLELRTLKLSFTLTIDLHIGILQKSQDR